MNNHIVSSAAVVALAASVMGSGHCSMSFRRHEGISMWSQNLRQNNCHPLPTTDIQVKLLCTVICLPLSLLDELQKLGIQCFYHNTRLVGWANVIFLCCLPSQLPKICVEIQTRLERACTVYSFVAAVPIPRYFVRVSTKLADQLSSRFRLLPPTSTPAPTSWSWSFSVMRWKQFLLQRTQPAFLTVSYPLHKQHSWAGHFL